MLCCVGVVVVVVVFVVIVVDVVVVAFFALEVKRKAKVQSFSIISLVGCSWGCYIFETCSTFRDSTKSAFPFLGCDVVGGAVVVRCVAISELLLLLNGKTTFRIP